MVAQAISGADKRNKLFLGGPELNLVEAQLETSGLRCPALSIARLDGVMATVRSGGRDGR